MSLTNLQIIALQKIPYVGIQSILKVGKFISEHFSTEVSSEIIVECLRVCNIKTRKPGSSNKIFVTLEDFNAVLDEAKKIVEQSNELHIGMFSYYSNEFPKILKDAKDKNDMFKPPVFLYYKGNLDILKMPCIAILGTRENTKNAEIACDYIAGKFAKLGFCIVSGLAQGCDYYAHKGALNAGGKTIAFLENGLDSIYPSEHTDLANEIIEKGGLLLSEYPVGEKVTKYSPVDSDRLQAGLSLATIVIQAELTDDVMFTANATLNSGKKLYVVRYKDPETNIHEKTLGNHLLIKNGGYPLTGYDNFQKIKNEVLANKFYAHLYDDFIS